GFSRSRRTAQHYVRFVELNAITGFLAVHINSLVVVVNRYCKLLLCLFLPDYVFIEESLYFLGLGKLVGGAGRRGCGAVIFQHGGANSHALVANVSARRIA